MNPFRYYLPLLFNSGDKPSNAAEDISTFRASKAAGYFLLHFNHSDIPFSKVVIKRDNEIVYESKYAVAAI
jgi:hypothetical protein